MADHITATFVHHYNVNSKNTSFTRIWRKVVYIGVFLSFTCAESSIRVIVWISAYEMNFRARKRGRQY